MRTTIDIDDPVLRDLKRLQKREGKSLGRLVSDLLVIALAQSRDGEPAPPDFQWVSRDMGPRLDLADRDALHDVMDEPTGDPTDETGDPADDDRA